MFQRRNLKEIRKYFELNENENRTGRNLWNTAKAVLNGKLKALNTYKWIKEPP